MTEGRIIEGFSRLSREEKIRLIASHTSHPGNFIRELKDHWHPDPSRQHAYEEFTENTVSNYFLPLGFAPNFKINGSDYIVPMVTEESSVVAAAASAAKFWWPLGGFTSRVSEKDKPGHIHLIWKGDHQEIRDFTASLIPGFRDVTGPLTGNMNKRGGGILAIRLKDCTNDLSGYYQIEVLFNTGDAMGANFINTCLEIMAGYLQQEADRSGISDRLEIIMSILSNYTESCRVECMVSCHVNDLSRLHPGVDGVEFARKFETAVLIAGNNVHRAVTHNKGIYNGIDAVLLATGNDFRAAEAAGHAWASRDGTYRGLTRVEVNYPVFTCKIDIPLSVGVVGGLTSSHPMARLSLDLLGNPDAGGLMGVAAAVGLANNFSAVKSLITGGIQKGHMRLHLVNLLNRLGATEGEKSMAVDFFRNKVVTAASVEKYINYLRNETR